jgi:hypothetical protein
MAGGADRTLNINRVVNQVRREATANPKQAAILGLLMLVAVYYWAPLIWGWVTPTATAAESATVQSADASARPTKPSSPQKVSVKPQQQNWQDLASWRKSDPYSTTASSLSSLNNPFVTNPDDESDATPQVRTQHAITSPAELGLTLTSTIVGANSIALINGRAYRVGRAIIVEHGGGRHVFELVEVGPRSAILSQGGVEFALTMERTDSGSGLNLP